MIPFILKTDTISMFPAGRAPVTIHSDHMNFHAVKDALIEGRFDDALDAASVAAFVNKITAGAVAVDDNGVTFNGVTINNYLSDKMLQFFHEGLNIQHYCRFLENLMANPSMTSREELYLFLEAANLPISEDGCFLAYKAVRGDYMDKHSGTFSNAPGCVLEMPRREVDDRRDRTCSYGFHAAAYDYAKNFLGFAGDRLMVVKINPADVVSVPSDYNNQKLRTCKYVVVEEIPGALDTLTGRAFVSLSQYNDEAENFPDDDSPSDYDRGYNDGIEGRPAETPACYDYYEGYDDGKSHSF
jgi:hypothetical protein